MFLSIFPDIPSGPHALLVSIARRRPNTSSSVQRMVSGGIVEGLTMKCWDSASVKGGISRSSEKVPH